MLVRSFALAGTIAMLVGACSWPPGPSLPAAPTQTAQEAANQGTDATQRTVDQTVGTVDRTVGTVGRTTGGAFGGAPIGGGGGGGGLLR